MTEQIRFSADALRDEIETWLHDTEAAAIVTATFAISDAEEIKYDDRFESDDHFDYGVAVATHVLIEALLRKYPGLPVDDEGKMPWLEDAIDCAGYDHAGRARDALDLARELRAAR